ncbi:MAG: type II secretion system protein GspG [Byssovorax sp.]
MIANKDGTEMNEQSRLKGLALRRGAARRALARGVTLVEVMIVIVLMGVIASIGVGVFWPRLKEGRVKAAVMKAAELKTAAEYYRETAGSDCPSIQELLTAKRIKQEQVDDPWNSPYRILCEGGEIKVISPGPDRKEGTADDCRDDFPKKQADVDKIVNGG